MSNNVEIEKEFSSYYKHADDISNKAQKKYIHAFKGTVIPLIVASGVSCITGLISERFYNTLLVLNSFIIVCILISIICSIMVHQSKLQKFWYEGRAVAESLKTMGWKYVNCTAPYENSEDPIPVDERFVADLKSIMENNEDILERIKLLDENAPTIITQAMKNFRNLSWQEKKDIYLDQRIKDQRGWYADKAKTNSDEKNKWFSISVLLQILALLAIFFIVKNSNITSDLVGFLSSASTAIVSWIQVKRYQELQQAYSTTAFELDIIYNQGNQIDNARDFLSFVEDAEKAISREHTLWIARRDHTKLRELLKD
ncbi:DUF4231 domain-containing protein [Bacillus infantis]|uniref:DUF4231 domain-containing protein n=1 Tax=Bacillus infantis TaxID=324767 RepID=A0A5D4RN57_9BACI|nr:DUF4231 domain-containing protein [Bacillus infantis]TYS51236.1 DUF4231 domain-containing protein [Bacillus infantis]